MIFGVAGTPLNAKELRCQGDREIVSRSKLPLVLPCITACKRPSTSTFGNTSCSERSLL